MSETLLAVDEAVRGQVPVDETDWNTVAPVPTIAPSPTAPAPTRQVAETNPPATAAGPLVVRSIRAIKSSTAVYVVGVAENTTDRPLGDINLSVGLYTPDGSLAGQESTNISGFDIAPAHGQFPFFVLIDVPAPGWTVPRAEMSGTPVNLSVGGMRRYLDLTGEASSSQSGIIGYDVSGKIVNTGNRPAKYVSFVVIAYDKAGTLLDLHHSMITSVDVIPAGASVAFKENMLHLNQRPARLVVLAQGVDETTIP
ncbi:MAG: hypothetical protein CYG59_05000 [Chloroflexi bacterium]|nr:MAG: hypothetical protein CYG59_05000 [Chloroflexota bacterium]